MTFPVKELKLDTTSAYKFKITFQYEDVKVLILSVQVMKKLATVYLKG